MTYEASAVSQVPDACRLVGAAGDGDRVAVQLGAGHVDRAVVAGEGGQGGAGAQVPDPRCWLRS